MRLKPITRKAVEQIFGIRSVLEPYAIVMACENISQEDIIKLKSLNRSALEVINSTILETENKIKVLLELNTEFHDILCLATDNPFLIQIINKLRSIVIHMRSLGVRENSAWKQSWSEHREIIGFLESRDSLKAADLMKKHVENAKHDVMAHADRLPG